MFPTWQKIAIAAGLAAVLALAWFIPAWFGLKGADVWMVRAGIAILGVAAAAIIWMVRSKKAAEAVAGGGAATAAAGQVPQVDLLFREAERKLAASALGKKARIANLPAVLMIGEAGSAKTTTIMQSGLSAELLAGQAMQGSLVAPTETVNLWLAGGMVFVDVGGKILGDAQGRAAIARKAAPLSSVLSTAGQAPRVAVVCQDAEAFLKPGAPEATAAAAERLREFLGEVCTSWGIQLPVYVLFTRMDRAGYFSEYVGSLTDAEAGMALGSTLSIAESAPTATYGEAQNARLTAAFQAILHGLADKRPEYLSRERDAAKLAGVYQFPRELRKMRNLMVKFLVELARPSQLHAGPFLRGFYFTGVRPVIVSDVAAAPREAPREAVMADATGIFLQAPQPSPEAAAQPRARRVPQWVFLRRLFSDLILKDSAAFGSSSTSFKTSFLRRVLLSAAAGVGLFLLVAWIVSYSRNSGLEEEVMTAARAVPSMAPAQGELASEQALAKLDGLRAVVAKLRDFEKDGAPWSYRWGLYTGDDLYPLASRIYFGHFRRLLLAQTQGSLLGVISSPATAGGGYKPVYDALKAYLITTSHPDKSTREFLPPVLMEHWLKGRAPDPPRAELARRQFEYYSVVLPEMNPYPSAKPDETAVATGRKYLSQFAATETLYQAMVATASQRFPTIRFNQQNPGSADVIRNNYAVPGAFTKEGFAFMQEAIKNPEKFFSGERWVMGDVNIAVTDKAKLQQELAARLYDDFLTKWREYLRETSVVRFGLSEAGAKLTKLSDIQSPLLGVLCVASTNTALEKKELAEVFQPAQHVTPPGCVDKLTAPSNQAYMEGLIKLKAALMNAAANPTNEALKTEAIATATSAQVAAQLVAQNFRIDKDGQTHAAVKKALDDPILYAMAALGSVDKQAINGKAGGLCAQLQPLLAKYPFQPKATVEASLPEVAAVFAPGTGALWQLYDTSLAKLLVRQGSDFVPVPTSGMTLRPQFLAFFRQAAAVSTALFRGGSPQPQLTFALRPYPTEGIQSVTLNIHGQKFVTTGNNPPMQFNWPGAGALSVEMAVKIAGGSDLNYPSYSGLWALWRFFSYAEPAGGRGSEFSLEWTLRTAGGPVTLPKSGRPVTVRFDLDMLGAPPVLRPGFLSSMGCVAQAVQ